MLQSTMMLYILLVPGTNNALEALKLKSKKNVRQQELKKIIAETPFVSDEELSEMFQVSIQTIRLDRLAMGIPELRERMRAAAQRNYSKIVGLGISELIGEIIELEINGHGISFLEANREMTFEKTDIVKGHYIFSMAESLALAVINTKAALTGVANMKYSKPVSVGDKLVAKAEVFRQRNKDYIVHVKITVKQEQVFRGKFILVPILN